MVELKHQKSRVTLILVAAAIAATILARYYEFEVAHQFLIETNLACDVTSQSCFTMDCDANDPECDSSPYEKVEMAAYNAPSCAKEHTCESFSCEGRSGCTITFCSEDTLDEGETCTEIPAISPEEEATTTPEPKEGSD
jgi:hypothetical protein